MSAEDQWFGLNRGASDLVKDAVAAFPYTPVRGAFCDVVEWLHIFHLEDGRILKEVIQETRWNDGPKYYTALMTKKGNIIKASIWSKEEMEQA